MSDSLLKIVFNDLTEDEIRVLSILRKAIGLKYSEFTVQVHEGRVVAAEIREKIRF